MACCSAARMKMKAAAKVKATKQANAAVKGGKKIAAKKQPAKKVPAKKTPPCTPCGKAAR